ncbi:MAG: thiolase family protein [Myxococcales bacterium]|nr:thiolase family protein [Myxococcales bacterium]
MSFRSRAAIVGVGELAPVKYTEEESTLDLMVRVGLDAVDDAGIGFDEIDGLLVHPVGGISMLVPSTLVELLGMKVRFAETVDLGGATGAAMVWRAAQAIASGMCESCLCITASRRGRGRSYGIEGMQDRSAYAEFEVPFGAVGANFGYAQIATRYQHEYGVAPETLAEIAVSQRDNACLNPAAFFHGQPISVDDVLASPMIVDPLHLLEIVMPVGGGAALLVTSAEKAKSLAQPPAFILGAGEHVTHKSITYAPDLCHSAVTAAAESAFAMAGVGPEQIGLASLYDCYTITVLLTLEDAGFCDKGEGGRFVEEHDLRAGGDFPLNTHGGQLSFGQAGIAGGTSHVTEAARQVQGRCGERQIKDLEFAFVNGNGGIMSEQASLVLGANP